MSRQKLGQHFLADTSWRKRIAETLPPSPDSVWLEIGAGQGEMTEFLAKRARRVIAIETDAALVAPLRARAAEWSTKVAEANGCSIEIVHADVLSLNLAALISHSANDSHPAMSSPLLETLKNIVIPNPGRSLTGVRNLHFPSDVGEQQIPRSPRDDTNNNSDVAEKREAILGSRQGTASAMPKNDVIRGASVPESSLDPAESLNQLSPAQHFRVYGNLPYYITSPILAHLFRFAAQIDSIHIVTQLEVAERIAAHPGSRDYGYLSTLCQYYARPELLFRIPPGAFHPPPKVTSALLEMHLPGERASLGIEDDAAFLKFLQTCFAHKRKTLRNNLRSIYPHNLIAKALAASALTDHSRAEELTLRQFAHIFVALNAGEHSTSAQKTL